LLHYFCVTVGDAVI